MERISPLRKTKAILIFRSSPASLGMSNGPYFFSEPGVFRALFARKKEGWNFEIDRGRERVTCRQVVESIVVMIKMAKIRMDGTELS